MACGTETAESFYHQACDYTKLRQPRSVTSTSSPDTIASPPSSSFAVRLRLPPSFAFSLSLSQYISTKKPAQVPSTRYVTYNVEHAIWSLGGKEEGYSEEGYPRCQATAGDAPEEGEAS